MRHDHPSSDQHAAVKASRPAQLSLGLLLAAVTLLVYLPARQHGFVSYDDPVYVTGNAHVQLGLTGPGIKWAFTTAHAGNWHPITWLSHMLDVQLFGPGPSGPHVVNVLIHVANTILLFLLLQRFTGALWRSALVAALFALHPLHVESVAWVAERKDVLSAFFGLGALMAYGSYATHRSYGTYVLSLVLFALGLMSKPMLVTLPFVMLLLDYWPLGRMTGVRGQVSGEPAARVHVLRFTFQSLVWEKIPFFALSLLSCVVTFVVQKKGGAVQSLSTFSLSERIGNALVSYGRYLGKTFWPADLAVPYPHPGHWPVGHVVLAGVVVAALSFAAVWLGRKAPFVATGWFWFFGMLIPAIGLIQVGDQSMADRYMYLPLIGVLMILVWGAGEVSRWWRVPRLVMGVMAGTIVIACAAATRAQLRHWQSSETLFRHTLASTTGNSLAHNNLGNALLDRKQVDDAIVQFRTALDLQPNYADAHINLGNALLEQGKPDEAMAQIQEALRIQPDSVEAHYNLGNVLLRAGDLDEAIAHFRRAVDLSADHVLARNNLAHALLQKGQPDEAIRYYREAVAIRPDFVVAHHNLGTLLLERGQTEEAVAHFRKVVEIQPNSANVHNNLGWMLRQTGQLDEAVAQLETALKLQPDYPDAQVNLAKTFLLMGKATEAISHFRAALKLQPDDARTLADLAWVLATWPEASVRNGAEALELAQRAEQISATNKLPLLEALAAAYAEAGRFAEAAEAAQRAVAVAESSSNAALAEILRAQLKLYQANTPLREKVLLPGN